MSTAKKIQVLLGQLADKRDVEEPLIEERFHAIFYHDKNSKRNRKHSGKRGLVVAFDPTEKASKDTLVFVYLEDCDQLVEARIAAFESPTNVIKNINTILGVEHAPREKRRVFREKFVQELFGDRRIVARS